ncbi:hypothetical protein PVAP13_9KG620800 [Panicum virgatum]|uniref:Uncharacterized protein n=1 Tax=Panicum virgatum TaxID=38727 RepID=A0A8T0NZ76_PANVG|nr:hypothetical protein PVAP13_9KG620800 [Panicum virgatum]
MDQLIKAAQCSPQSAPTRARGRLKKIPPARAPHWVADSLPLPSLSPSYGTGARAPPGARDPAGGRRQAPGSWRPRGARVNKPFFFPSPLLRVRPGLQFCQAKQLQGGGREPACLPARPRIRRALEPSRDRAGKSTRTHPACALLRLCVLPFCLCMPPIYTAHQPAPAKQVSTEQQPAANRAAEEARRQECECEKEADRAEGPVGTGRPDDVWVLANPIPRTQVRAAPPRSRLGLPFPPLLSEHRPAVFVTPE